MRDEKQHSNAVNGIIILLSIFLPPLALFLIWKYRKDWFKRHHVAVTLVALWCIFFIFAAINGAVNPSSTKTNIDNTNSQKTTQQADKITTKTETKTSVIAFAKKTQDDSTLASGQTKVSQAGVDGERATTYEVTYKNGKEISRRQTKQETTKQPVDEITLVGTYVAPTATTTPTTTTQSGTTYYCEDGTVATGDPSAKGRANSCYGHGGWVINHER